MDLTEKEKAAIMKSFKEAEARAMRAIKRRMRMLSKDKNLIKQIEGDIKKDLGASNKKTISK